MGIDILSPHLVAASLQDQLIGGGARRSAQQIDLSCYHVRMQRILAVCCFFS